jgi:hypothetical protein
MTEIDLDALNALDQSQIDRLAEMAAALREVAACAQAFAASLQRLQALQIVTPQPSDDPERRS